LNISQYKLLCKTCDSILEKNKSIYRVAIPLLHVIREHPFVLRRYQDIFKNDKKVISEASRKKKSFSGAYKKALSLLAFERLTFKNIAHKKIDVVFVSHLVSVKHLDLEDDFYFSNIPEFLKSKDINSLVMLINHTNESASNISKRIKDSKIPRIVIPKKMSLSGEAKILIGVTKELMGMRKESNRTTGFLKNSLKFFSSFNGASGALFGLRVGNYVQQVLSHFKPSTVITIYEGHAWERLVYNVAAQENILRIGYQHSVVTQYAHAMCRSLGRNYDPDIIYTSGTVTNNHLTRKLEGSHTKVATFGSNKLLNITSTPKVVKKTKTCLVVPEGLDSECEILFSFALQCANKLTNVNFIWRVHPQLSFSEVLEQMHLSSKDIPKNITISKLSLTEDINLSTHVLYRGSTAVIESIYKGLIPIYLSDGSDMTIDLLYGVLSGRKIVDNFDNFSSVLNEQSESDIKNLQHYCKQYFTQLDCSILIHEIEMKIKNSKKCL
jgi:hypothetical protein